MCNWYAKWDLHITLQIIYGQLRYDMKRIRRRKMKDWAPIIVGVILFILLSPGLIIQLPGNQRHVEFGSFTTNGKAVLIHTILFFGIFTIFILAIDVHIYFG